MPTVGLRAATAVAYDRGVSDVTLWRWRTRGWIKSVNVSGKIYIDLASLADFDRRAAAGEFSKVPAGAALKSTAARVAKLAAGAAGASTRTRSAKGAR